MMNKIPPQSIEAEESILSAALLGAATDVVELLRPTEFYRTSHQKIFTAITELVESKTEVDLITTTNRLREKGLLDECGGAAYLAHLIDTVPGAVSLRQYSDIIKAAHQKRSIIQICTDTIHSCYDDFKVDEILGQLDKETSKIATHNGRFHKIGDLLPESLVRLEKFVEEKLKNGGNLYSGIPCGLADVDKLFGGFQNSNLYVIGARPSMGKSALGMRFLRGAAENGYPGLFISIEMSKEQVVTREIACESRIDNERFRSGDIQPHHWDKITDAAGKINTMPIWIDDSPIAKIKEVQAKIRQFVKQHGRSLIVIDYLQYIKGLDSERKDIEIGTITRSLKASSKEHQIPIILLAQLNRALEQRTDKHPEISDLRGSGEIEQDADVIAFLYRDEVYNRDESNPLKGTAELNVKKFRDGKLGPVFLAWIDYRTTFENLTR